MGLSILGALLALIFALLGQSPKLVQRLGLSGARLDLKVRTFTTYAFALLLISIGFFLAGIPVGSDSDEPQDSPDTSAQSMVTEDSASVSPTFVALDELSGDMSDEETSVDEAGDLSVEEDATPATGSFQGPPPVSPDLSPESEAGSTAGDEVEGAAPDNDDNLSSESTSTPRPTSTPTTVASPTPTATPQPTVTPTPIVGETATVSSGGSTIWIVRSPGGQNLTLVRDGDILLVLPGHANQAGLLWREVRTVDGILGWIQETFLEYDELT